MTEVPIERALHSDILIELLENRDSERDDRIGTLKRLAQFGLLLVLRIVNFRKRDCDLYRVTFTFFDIRLWFRFLDFGLIHKWLEA